MDWREDMKWKNEVKELIKENKFDLDKYCKKHPEIDRLLVVRFSIDYNNILLYLADEELKNDKNYIHNLDNVF